ncbi:MAG: hypothetical protein U9Q08_00155 [Candidatus Omnitrophota bacterium]|nr:hypothetical protein [Candidatus Omnitrophota bacterium]
MDEVLTIRIMGWMITAVCFLVAVGFLVFPKSMNRVSQKLDRGFHPMENLDKALKKQISDKWVVTSSRMLGLVALVVAVVFFAMLLTV